MSTGCKARGSIHSQDGCLFHRSFDQGTRHGKSNSACVSLGSNACSEENQTWSWEERQNGRIHADCPSEKLSSTLWETPSETSCASDEGRSPFHSSPSCASHYRLCKDTASNGEWFSPKQDGDKWNHFKSEAGRQTVRSASLDINRASSHNHSDKELQRRRSSVPSRTSQKRLPAFAAIVPHQLEERQQEEAEQRVSGQSSAFSWTVQVHPRDDESLHECRSEDSESVESFRMHNSRRVTEDTAPVQFFPAEREEHKQDSFADSMDARQRCRGCSRLWTCCRWPRADDTRAHQG